MEVLAAEPALSSGLQKAKSPSAKAGAAFKMRQAAVDQGRAKIIDMPKR
ncbi:hypothetical protein [Bradyrhizobium stylosanthis]|nr:hypothetical protein [Bradyrhizobium stylosanthis]